MKKTSRSCCSRSSLERAAALCLGACLCLCLLVGCGPRGGQEQQPLRIGVALYQQDDTFIATVVQNMERLAREEEEAQDVKINLSIVDGRSNQTVQLEQIDRMLDQGYDVICVNIVDRTAAAVLIDKAAAVDVPLIFFNRQPVEEDMSRWEKVYYVGAKAAQSGQLQGEMVRELWQDRREEVDRNGDGVLQYVMLEGEPGHQDTLLRTQYAISALVTTNVKVEKLASDTANWARGQAASKMALWLEELDGRVEVVFANNDDMALGAIDALQAAGIAPEEMPVVVGVDATPPAVEAIRAGTLHGTVLNDSAGIAGAMMDLALALSRGEEPARAVALEEGRYVWLPYQRVERKDIKD